jgi:hypothetical protein
MKSLLEWLPSGEAHSAEAAPPGGSCDDAVAHVGVVFVHGVGFQDAGQTFVDAVAPLIRLIREAGYPQYDPLPDPVIRGGSIAGTTLPFAEIAVPTVELDGAQHWIVTEAWWASSFRPPNLATMLRWLGVEGGIARAARRLRWRPPVSQGPRTGGRSVWAGMWSERVLLTAVGSLLLVGYAALRAVFTVLPIASLRTLTIGGIDRFMTGWAGDMRVMIQDEAQAGMIRARIVESIQALVGMGCTRVVIAAHSGGVVASYMTLTDPANADLPVSRFITFGQGLSVAWRLLDISAETGSERAHSVGSFLAHPLPDHVEWTDYFATDDPVPAGPIWAEDGPATDSPPPGASRPVSSQSRDWSGTRIANRWELPRDHGEYFANDEQFLLPVARAIYDTARIAGAIPLMKSTASKQRASVRREQRVRVLHMWRLLTMGAAVLALFLSVAVGLIRAWAGHLEPLYQPVKPVVDALVTIWNQFGISKLFLPPEAAQEPPLWQVSALGFMLWPTILGVVVWTLAPRWNDWRGAWPAKSLHITIVTGAVSGVLLVAMTIALLIGIPGLVGVGLQTTPIWDNDTFQSVFRYGILEWATSVGGPIIGSLAMNLAITASVVAIAALIGLALWGLYRGLRRWTLGSAVLVVCFEFLAVVALSSLVWVLAVNHGFRVHAAGWLVIFIVAKLVQSIGVWRWNSWDEQERVEARSRWRDGATRRRMGRAYDSFVFIALSTSLVIGAIALSLRPISEAVFLGGGLIAVGLLGVAVGVGVAQDTLNYRSFSRSGVEP